MTGCCRGPDEALNSADRRLEVGCQGWFLGCILTDGWGLPGGEGGGEARRREQQTTAAGPGASAERTGIKSERGGLPRGSWILVVGMGAPPGPRQNCDKCMKVFQRGGRHEGPSEEAAGG